MSRSHGSVAISGRNLSGVTAQVLPPPLPAARARAQQAQATSGLRSEELFDDVAHAPTEPIEIAPNAERGVRSGAFAKGARPGFGALRPESQPPAAALSTFDQIYGTLPSSERAELPDEDLSLDVANPFLASSLQPPPPRSRLRVLGWVGGALALVGLGYAAASFYGNPIRAALRPATVVQVKAVAAAPVVQAKPVVAAPAIQAPAIVAAPVTPAPVVVAAPVIQAAVAVAEPTPALVATAPSTSFPEPSAAPIVEAPEAAEPAVVAASKPVVAKTRATAKHRAPKRRAASKPAVTASARAERPSAPAAAVVAAPLPAEPTRAEVRASMESMRGALQSCAAGAHGEILTTLTISGDGRVMHSLIKGDFVGTPQGSCMARALREAKFPAFSSPRLNVGYPYVF